MQGNQAAENAWGRLTWRVATVTAVLLVAYTGWYLLRHSDFNNDDLDNFVFMQHTGFWQFVLTPTDVHYVPMHRLLTWLVYHIAPMRFSVALAVLMIFHIGTLIYLACSLRLLRVGQASGLLVCGYAASSLIVFGLGWWAHAEHRVPYVFLDMCAIYHYLAWLRSRRRVHLWIAALAFVLAFGFYEKAVLIPLHMLVIGYLSDELRFRPNLRKNIWPPALLALGSAAYVLFYLLLHPNSVQTALPQAIRADLEFVKVLFAAASGFAMESFHDVPIHGMNLRLIGVLLLGSVMLVWSIWRGDGSWKVLLAMLLITFLDYLPITMSNRIVLFDLGIAHQYRFGYEELQLVVLFVGIWFARVAVVPISEQGRKVLWLAGFCLVIIYTGFNSLNLRMSRHQLLSWQWALDHSHIYLAHLRGDLADITERAPVFENDKLPGYLTFLRFTPDTRALLPLFVPNVRFDDAVSPRYKVLQDGHVEHAR
ncbi:hypothetical protein [Rhodanobacter koreensis]